MPIEKICRSCEFFSTKPGREPEYLTQAIVIAYQLEEDDMVCGGFDYPAILDYLDPFEWVCIASIKAARKISESKSVKPEQDKPKPNVAHLQRLSRGY